ncbi:GNAT family N-acetyltransferase [Nonomuraea sp. NBC_01738]|uniref:GNAT family N-acetyltransferase n=1 Tax=Nonomuraea sp. NBC_01738 TaxID=2976003 RepID=UPI002E120D8B|nr:GNAT family N-acetyltransferase [Nonomuraea sp. NBC_01738]
MSRWAELTGGGTGDDYASRFAALAAAGADVHGEARFVEALAGPGARILDAGCGTGRVAIRLAEQGYDVAGVDLDPSMLAVARRVAPSLDWIEGDLSTVSPPGAFDVVVAAGNVIPLLAEGTEAVTVANLARSLKPGGALVAGFGLDAAHLPVPPAITLADYDAWCAAASLKLEARYSTWDAAPYADGDGYAVSVHRAAEPRVSIRPLTAEDEPAFLRLIEASRALHHRLMTLPSTPEEFRAFLRRFDDPEAARSFVIVIRETGELAGSVNINSIIRGRFQNGSLGYAAFGPSAGKGYMTEGVGQVVRYAFEELRLHRLEAQIQPGNLPSSRLVERLGFTYEGSSPSLLFVDGEWRDHDRWAILNPAPAPHPTLPAR